MKLNDENIKNVNSYYRLNEAPIGFVGYISLSEFDLSCEKNLFVNKTSIIMRDFNLFCYKIEVLSDGYAVYIERSDKLYMSDEDNSFFENDYFKITEIRYI